MMSILIKPCPHWRL